MSHISDDKNQDEFMNASAEEWSKPSTPAERPAPKPEPTDRWGSPLPEKGTASDSSRWGSQPPSQTPGAKKSGSKWWVILIIVVVVLCLCACLVMFGLPALGLTLMPTDFFQF